MEQEKLYQEAFEKVLQFAIDKSFYRRLRGTLDDVKVTAIVKSMTPIKIEYRVKFAGDNHYIKFVKTVKTLIKNDEIDFNTIIARERYDLSNIVPAFRKERAGIYGKDIQ